MSTLGREFGAEMLFGKAEDMDALADLILAEEMTLAEVLVFLRLMAVRLRASSDEKLRRPVVSRRVVDVDEARDFLQRCTIALVICSEREQDFAHTVVQQGERIDAALAEHYSVGGLCCTCTASGWGDMEPMRYPLPDRSRVRSRVVTAYYEDDLVALYLGDFREVLPAVLSDAEADVLVADPPYGETSLVWDRWPEGWPSAAALYSDAMWCFGSMRMFLDHWIEFADWRLSQDIVWEKHNGSGFHADRFRRVHEHALHLYRGQWADVHHEVPTTSDATARSVKSKRRPAHTGQIERTPYVSLDGGPRLKTSVMYAPSAHGTAINETQKPVTVVEDLLRYACPPGGLVLDIFAGSATTLVAARHVGMRAVGVELREDQCERAALRLSQGAGVTAPTLLAQPEHHGLVDGMPMEAYLAVRALSAGSAEALAPSTPAAFREDQLHSAASDAMDLGKVAHTVILEGADLTDLANAGVLVVVDAADWRTAAAQQAKASARAAGKPALLAKKLPQVRRMAEQILANDMAAALFDPETGKAEQSMFWTHKRTGHPRKGRLDKFPARRPSGRLIIPDYKTTEASADQAEFGRTVVNLGYAQQLAGYEEGVLALELDDDPLFLLVVQETRPPYLVNVLEVPDDGMRIARELNLWAASIYAQCVETDTWPGYPAEVQQISLPSWWLRKYEEFAK